MQAYQFSGLMAAILFAGTAGAQTSNDVELSPILQGKITAYLTCLKDIDGKLRLGYVTPERYQMAVEGACLDQSEAVHREMKVQLDAIPHSGVSYDDAQATTANTLEMVRAADERRRKAYVSSYVLWYTSSDRPQGKSAR